LRKLLDGRKVADLDNAVVLEVRTKCPNKWKLIDMETGEEYVGNMPDDHYLYWKKINEAS
jgi:hypothetical protein